LIEVDERSPMTVNVGQCATRKNTKSIKMKFISFIILIMTGLIPCSDYIFAKDNRSYPAYGYAISIKDTLPFYQQLSEEIPVLCYHHIKSNIEGKSPDYTISINQFRSHIKVLYDSGYNTILPEQLYQHLLKGASLPRKPIMITFDDTHEEHYSIVAPILDSFGYKGVFFVLAVPIGKPGYMSSEQIKLLSDRGHAIGGHSWDHPDLRKLLEKDWNLQLTKPNNKLEQITGQPVFYFAYPYGSWNETAIHELKKHGIKVAFQLSDKLSQKYPLYTIRRLMVGGKWTPATLQKNIKTIFKKSARQVQVVLTEISREH
jgi:peptidoglycan/xylan/chitin deacetylase (PgdA/CDA1 family)